jgi:hypothetical protein
LEDRTYHQSVYDALVKAHNRRSITHPPPQNKLKEKLKRLEKMNFLAHGHSY